MRPACVCVCVCRQVRLDLTVRFIFGGSVDCWERAELQWDAEMTGMLRDGVGNLGTGVFGEVRLDHRVMSVRHLDSSFTATSHADSTLTWQIHTSHFTPRLFVTGKSQHALWMCFRRAYISCVCSVCTQVDVYAGLCMFIQMCFCCRGCDSGAASVRQKDALADAARF